MKTYLTSLFVLFVVAQCSSTTFELALYKLQLLEEAANKDLDDAIDELNKMSNEIDATALAAKNEGAFEILKKKDLFLAKQGSDKVRKHLCRGSRDHYAEELAETYISDLNLCVDKYGNDSVDVIEAHRAHLESYIWKSVKEEEKNIIRCAHNGRCLNFAAAAIGDKSDELINVIQDELSITNHHKETYLQSIKQCLSVNIALMEAKLHSFPLCVF